jgi:hypothetical protein
MSANELRSRTPNEERWFQAGLRIGEFIAPATWVLTLGPLRRGSPLRLRAGRIVHRVQVRRLWFVLWWSDRPPLFGKEFSRAYSSLEGRAIAEMEREAACAGPAN